MSLTSDFQKLVVDGLIMLFELDATKLGAGVLRFHGHISRAEWERIYTQIGEPAPHVITDPTVYTREIIWQGQVFDAMPLQISGLERRSDGRASAPTLTMANNIGGLQGAVSAYCLQFNDFAGAKVKVITTLVKYLDAANFSNGNPSAANEAKEQIWFVEQKTSENAQQVTFELSNPIDFEGLKIPVRDITNYCAWEYRGEECGYTGAARFTIKGEPTIDPTLDQCSKRLKGCRLRFGNTKPLSFGGMPASAIV